MTYEVMIAYRTASLVLTNWEDGHAAISSLYTTDRRKGHATELLTRATRLADERMLILLLEVVGDGCDNSMTDDQLQKFYEKFGFVVVSDQKEPLLMERKPPM
jgi:ribosomal protein S18 acetylase RimI-like enzyme